MASSEQISKLLMYSESLISHMSNIPHSSLTMYQDFRKQYLVNEFLKESLLPGLYSKATYSDFRQQQGSLSSLSLLHGKAFTPGSDCISAFTPYWTSQLHQNIQGTSDNQNQSETEKIKLKLEASVKIEEMQEDEQDADQQKGGANICDPEKIKNETKNIPKNFGKAIIIFIEKNRKSLQPILQQNSLNYDDLIERLKSLKKKINTIKDLRNLWEQIPESQSLRIISNHFLRRHALNYIYNSRIKTRICHVKYKKRLEEALLNPKNFKHIKDY